MTFLRPYSKLKVAEKSAKIFFIISQLWKQFLLLNCWLSFLFTTLKRIILSHYFVILFHHNERMNGDVLKTYPYNFVAIQKSWEEKCLFVHFPLGCWVCWVSKKSEVILIAFVLSLTSNVSFEKFLKFFLNIFKILNLHFPKFTSLLIKVVLTWKTVLKEFQIKSGKRKWKS